MNRPSIRIAWLSLALLLCLAACARSAGTGLPSGRLSFLTGSATVTIDVEIADTSLARMQGLRGRQALAREAGMAFLNGRPVATAFTMDDTLIPLSIAFWDEDGRIVAMFDMEPCPADPCPSYPPGVLYVGAVEVNRGFFAEHGVEVGDRVELER